MSGGFWAGAVPPWAYVVGGCLGVLLVMLGVWAGYGRGFAHAEEEIKWEREQAKARRVHAVYRQLPADEPVLYERRRPRDAREDLGLISKILAHEDQALTIANGQAVTTGEIQAITDEMDSWLAVHVYGAPRDYGQWLEQQDR